MPCNRLYIAITFHNNLTEAKIANELIVSVLQSLNILHHNYTQLSRVLFPGLHAWSNLGCYRSFMFPVSVNHAKRNTLVIDVESREQGILKNIGHGCSGGACNLSVSHEARLL